MIAIDELDIRANRALAQRINEDIQAAYQDFGHGAWINRTDVAATGMAAVLLQAKIAGLQIALKHIEQVDKELLGRGQKKERG